MEKPNEVAAAEAIQWLVERGYTRAGRAWTAPAGHSETADDIGAIIYAWHHATDEQLTAAGS